MKICYFADGRSIHTHRWLEYFAKLGHEVHLISDESYNGHSDSITHHVLQAPSSLRLVFRHLPFVRAAERILRLRRTIREKVDAITPSVVHAHFVAHYGHLALFSSFRPLVVTAWGSDIYLHDSWPFLSRVLTKLTLKRADLITCDSPDLKESMVKLGADKSKIHVIQFGVDTKLFAPSDSAPIREEFGLSTEDQILISPRSLRPIYNIDVIVRAVALVLAEFPRVKLVLKDFYSDEKYRLDIKALIQELKLEDRVKFLGYVSYQEMVKLYNLSDFVISLASTDSSPMSVLEAMSCGKVVIASDLPSLRDWIKEGANGFLVNPQDPNELGATLRCALTMDSEMKRIWSQRNRTIIRERGDQDIHMAKMEALYQGLRTRKSRH
jgi:glycosyltransferase involved in cell wall biosynthesis